MRKGALPLLALAALASGCGRGIDRSSLDVVARVGRRPVMLSAFRRYFEVNAGRRIAESSPQVVSALFDQLLREEIWRDAAGLHGSDGETERREAPGVLLARAGPAILATPAEVSAEYNAHPDRYRLPATAKVERIVIRRRDQAEAARRSILGGEDFAAAAKRLSVAPDAAQGGALGWVRRGDLPSEYEDAIFRTPVGQVTPLMPADEGYIFFRVDEKRPPEVQTLEEAQPVIQRAIGAAKAQKYLDGIIAEARRRGRVRIFAGRLPFVYSGVFSENEEQ